MQVELRQLQLDWPARNVRVGPTGGETGDDEAADEA